MGIDKVVDKTGESQGSGFGNVRNMIADKLHTAAEVIGEKAADQDAQSGIAQYGKKASGWLERSAEYVRTFDYEQADTDVREYVGQKPGRSLLIAGGIGLMLGAMLRRR